MGEHTMSIPRVLPLSVRFAAREKNGMLGSQEIADLLSAGFVDEAAYLLLELYAADHNAREIFLEGFVHCAWKYSTDVAICAYLEDALVVLPPDRRAPVRELIEMSWCGFMSRGKMELCAAINWVESRVPVFVGYPSTVALVPFIRHGTPFYLMFPQDNSGKNYGYEFYPGSDGHEMLLVDVDDIRETKVSVVFFPDKFWRQAAETLKVDFESSRPCDVILEPVLG